MRAVLVPALAVLAVIALAGCSGSSKAASAPTTDDVVVPSVNPFVSTAPAPTTPPPVAVGQPMTNGDFTLTVTSARDAASEAMLNAGPTLGTASGPAVLRLPPAGSRFIEVRTHLVNNGTEGADVVCEVVLAMQLVDDRGTLIGDDHLEEPDVIPGNPRCHVDLPPGGQEDVTWLYYVPAGAHIVAWRFKQFQGSPVFSTVRVDL